MLEAVKAGATGYLVKSASRQELLEAVQRVAGGGTVFTPGLAGLVLSIGIAVDANVLIYERLREEMAAGKSLAASIDSARSPSRVQVPAAAFVETIAKVARSASRDASFSLSILRRNASVAVRTRSSDDSVESWARTRAWFAPIVPTPITPIRSALLPFTACTMIDQKPLIHIRKAPRTSP